jgi:hypothetical protein
MDGDRENVDEPTISVRMGAIAIGGRNGHDVRTGTDVDDI